ncbi:REP element-mobilizing transposase RayT [Geothermobacter ehrlichii]|uniref:REP element-mobilizing transposase RayT n=2 Tax=Geothermobacter ehrlichii TaxID=213224 RepID=A0A5D3WP91_9BACT|nr:REP element-mobilizing transposase RayT [Geothermobacter ehrlichii]
MLRGNAGQDIFFDASDRSRFCLLLQQGTERFGVRIHAFCLMSNHLHLALQVGEVPLSRFMQNISFRYTQYLNRKRKTTGHLFQGRYKALLVDADSYLLELVRYIHLNPVRAGMANYPDEWSWSSHGAYLGRQTFPWLTTEWILGQLATEEDKAIERYRQFVSDGLHEGHRKEFHRGSFEGRVLGDDTFIERAMARSEQTMLRKLSVEEVMSTVASAYDLNPEELADRSRNRKLAEARAMVALLVRESEGMTLTSLADCLGHELAGLSQAARRLEIRIATNAGLAEHFERVKAQLSNCQS